MKKNQKKKKTKSQNQVNHQKELLEDEWWDESPEPPVPVLRFTPTAWAKLLYFRDRSDSEVGGFGIADSDDLLLVQEFVTVKQQVTSFSVQFDDEAVSRFFDDQVDRGRKPEHFARLWCHTHPGIGPEPSSVDEETFARVFGPCQWAVMCIIAQDGSAYARLSFHVGPGGQILIPIAVDYSREFGPTDHEAWEDEYTTNVRAVQPLDLPSETAITRRASSACGLPYDFVDEFERMDPTQRRLMLDELSERPDLWDEEMEATLL